MIKMILRFVNMQSTVALNQTMFSHPLLGRRLLAVRGTTAPPQAGTFRWSTGVRAMSVLVTRQAILSEARRHGQANGDVAAAIDGDGDSLAASLDYALSKQPLWLQDMFGVTPHGKAIGEGERLEE